MHINFHAFRRSQIGPKFLTRESHIGNPLQTQNEIDIARVEASEVPLTIPTDQSESVQKHLNENKSTSSLKQPRNPCFLRQQDMKKSLSSRLAGRGKL